MHSLVDILTLKKVEFLQRFHSEPEKLYLGHDTFHKLIGELTLLNGNMEHCSPAKLIFDGMEIVRVGETYYIGVGI